MKRIQLVRWGNSFARSTWFARNTKHAQFSKFRCNKTPKLDASTFLYSKNGEIFAGVAARIQKFLSTLAYVLEHLQAETSIAKMNFVLLL